MIAILLLFLKCVVCIPLVLIHFVLSMFGFVTGQCKCSFNKSVTATVRLLFDNGPDS
jgi:Na+/melibiose symporter-like transporter